MTLSQHNGNNGECFIQMYSYCQKPIQRLDWQLEFLNYKIFELELYFTI